MAGLPLPSVQLASLPAVSYASQDTVYYNIGQYQSTLPWDVLPQVSRFHLYLILAEVLRCRKLSCVGEFGFSSIDAQLHLALLVAHTGVYFNIYVIALNILTVTLFPKYL